MGPGFTRDAGEGDVRAHSTKPPTVTRVPGHLATGLTHATGRGPLTPHDTAAYGHKLATVVRAPRGTRASVVATTAFDYGASDNAAILKSHNDLLAHEFPRAKLTNIAQNAPPPSCRGRLCAFAGRASPPRG
jgi:hypothetical protein